MDDVLDFLEDRTSLNESLDKKRITDEIISLCATSSVSGFEYRAEEELRKEYGDRFDSYECDSVGNHIFFKSCKRENAPKIMIDAHFDEIGFLVTEVLDGGFLRIANLGGIDRAILQSADVVVYGEKELVGVIASVPPHLKEADDALPEIDELLVDVGLGYSAEELSSIAPVGTPVGFYKSVMRLANDRIAGQSFDNKACGAVALYALSLIDAEALAGDVYLTLSAIEETSRQGGAYVCANKLRPDYAMVIDVNLANAPDVPARESVKMGKGISISYSSSTSRALTRASAELCEKNDIPFIKKAEASSTGTNAVAVNIAGGGIPVVDVGLPLRNMHTYNEIIALDDCMSLARFIEAFVTDRELAERFRREELSI